MIETDVLAKMSVAVGLGNSKADLAQVLDRGLTAEESTTFDTLVTEFADLKARGITPMIVKEIPDPPGV